MNAYANLKLENLKVESEGPVLHVTLSRPKLLNPIDLATLQELNAVLGVMSGDGVTEIVVLRGEGRAFSAGGDLKRHLRIHQDAAQMGILARTVRETFERIDRADQLFIAVIDGLAVAGGIELMLRCDIVLASHDASFSDGHLNFSLLPGGGGTQLIPRMINPLRAKLFMLTADFIDGRRAEELGLVSAAYPRAELETRVTALIGNLCSKSFSSRAAIKHLVGQSLRTQLDAGLVLEGATVEHYESTHPDAHEGLLAFAQKRKPEFRRPSAAVSGERAHLE
jgi:enoyl-CoA hydratase